MPGSPRPLPGLLAHWEGSQDSAYCPPLGSDLLQRRAQNQKQQREKAHGVEDRLQPPASSPRGATQAPPQIPQEQVVTAPGKGCHPGNHEKLCAQGFYWGLVTEAPSAWHVAKSRSPEGRQVVSIKPTVRTQSPDTARPPYQSESGGSSLKTQGPRRQPRANLASGRPF